jgi:signal transduction histidine kinase
MKGLRIKFILWICLLFALLGILIYVSLSVYLSNKITSQILERDIKIAEYVSEQIKNPLLTKDTLSLNLLLHDNLKNLEDTEYIFIQDDRAEIVAHTFEHGFPADLVNINRLDGKSPAKIEKFLVEGREFYDLAVPILAGGLDSLHLGVSLKSGKREIAEFARINYYVTGVIFIGLGFGFVVLLFMGVQEAKRISSFEERNKLAIELHDGLAQSLANVVIRLELCQKLFNEKPKQALDELNRLKDNARELVRNARQAISNLRGFSK